MRTLTLLLASGFLIGGTACTSEEAENTSPLSAEILWDLPDGCKPDQMSGLGPRVLVSCRAWGEAPRSRVVDAATGETLAEWTYDIPAAVAEERFVLGTTEEGGLALQESAPDANETFLLPLGPDGGGRPPMLAIAARAALPSFEEGRPTFLSSPFQGGSWRLSAIEDGEVRTLFDLGIVGEPLGRVRLKGGLGVLHRESTTISWKRFDATGEALDEVQLTADFDSTYTFARIRLVQSAEGPNIVMNTQAGVRWFGLDEDGVVVTSAPLYQPIRPNDRWEGVALAPLSDGTLVLATTLARNGYDDVFGFRLLEDYQLVGRAAGVAGSRPGGQGTFFESIATPDGVLLVTERFELAEPFGNPVSGVLVGRPSMP